MKNTTYGKKYGKKTEKPTVKNNAPKGPQMPKEWLYLAEDEITPAQIYGLFAEEKSWKAEYWEEAEVVEIELPEAGSVDMENLGGASEDEAMEAYMKDRSLHTAYAVTIRPDDFEEAKKVMEYISSFTTVNSGFRQQIFSRRSGQKDNFYEKQLTYIDCRYTI